MKSTLLFLEAVLLAGPVTAFVAYLSIPALIMYFGLLLDLFVHDQATLGHDEAPLIAALVAFPLGVFALARLWSLAIATAKGRKHAIDRMFWLALACGLVSTLALTAMFNIMALLFCIPALILAAHMLYIQRNLRHAT